MPGCAKSFVTIVNIIIINNIIIIVISCSSSTLCPFLPSVEAFGEICVTLNLPSLWPGEDQQGLGR